MAMRRLVVPGAVRAESAIETEEQALQRENSRIQDMPAKQSEIPDDQLGQLIQDQDKVEITKANNQERTSSRKGRYQGTGEFKKRDLLQEVSDKVCQSIEEGTAPWQRSEIGHHGWPTNATTGKPYHGINVLLLATAGFGDSRWCSYEQAKKQGWQVRKDEKATRIYFYKMEPRSTDKIDPVTSLPIMKFIPIFKSYSIFNLSQVDKAPSNEVDVARPYELTDLTEHTINEIIQAAGVDIQSGPAPAYVHEDDTILMPAPHAFESDAHYYSALMKQLAHWSGHESRLNRASLGNAVRNDLRIDMAGAMLAMQLGLPAPAIDESKSGKYIDLLRNDKKEVFRAAKDAESITRFILRYDPELRAKLGDEVKAQAAAVAESGSPDEFFDASLFDEFDDEMPAFRP